MANILITGGTGSLGLSLIKSLQSHNITSLSRNELMISKARGLFPEVRFALADIRDFESIEKYFLNIDYVIHCAALKHVDNGQYYPEEFIKTNIVGSSNIIKASKKYNVPQIIFISSDKASSPDNVYGSSKLIAEQLFLNNKDANIKVVRFGNLIGSNGSVFDIWNNSNSSINLTDKNMTRFFIPRDNAAKIICSIMDMKEFSNTIFIPKMKSINMFDIASFYSKQKNISINIVGKRPGEKINELLMTSSEWSRAKDYGLFWILDSVANNTDEFNNIDSDFAEKWDLQELFGMI